MEISDIYIATQLHTHVRYGNPKLCEVWVEKKSWFWTIILDHYSGPLFWTILSDPGQLWTILDYSAPSRTILEILDNFRPFFLDQPLSKGVNVILQLGKLVLISSKAAKRDFFLSVHCLCHGILRFYRCIIPLRYSSYIPPFALSYSFPHSTHAKISHFLKMAALGPE